MRPAHVATLAAGYVTWIAFTVCMRYYFRRWRQADKAKDWLVRLAFVCTVTQLVALALVKPPTLLLAWAGLVCYTLANGFYWWALATHGKARPAFAFAKVTPAAFTQRGPYRLVRHPIYTAYLLGWLAGTFATGLPWLLVTVVGMGLLYYRAARLEEQLFLAGPVAPAYREYRSRTGMFLPKLVRGAARERGQAA